VRDFIELFNPDTALPRKETDMTNPVVIMTTTGGDQKPAGSSGNPFVTSGASFRRAAAVGTTPGDAVIVSGVTTAGTVTLTLAGGGTITESVPLGSTRLPYGVTAAVLGTAVGGTFQSLFYI
jgi:hypothetical protein